MRNQIQLGIILAAALTALSATSARADDEWCGYATHANAVIECGYTTEAQCETAVGQGGMCFVDPNYALNFTRAKPEMSPKIPVRG